MPFDVGTIPQSGVYSLSLKPTGYVGFFHKLTENQLNIFLRIQLSVCYTLLVPSGRLNVTSASFHRRQTLPSQPSLQ